jgi:hypothetical protein
MASSTATCILQAILFVLEVIDAAYKSLFSLWALIAAPAGRKGAASKIGSRPPPPKVVGIIIAEPDVSDVSIRTVSRLTTW